MSDLGGPHGAIGLPEKVRAKFMVMEITQFNWGPATRIVLRPQYSPEVAEDQRYAKATPNGEVWMTVDNPPAQAFFELGKTYYLDFTLVPDVPPTP